VSASHIYCELLVGTAQFTCYRRLTCIGISLDSCLLATGRIQLLVFISVDVRLQYFMAYWLSRNLNFILLPLCCSLFDSIKENSFSSYSFNTGKANIACALEQGSCCTVLKVGKSNKPNNSDGIRDFIHALHFHSLSSIGQLCCSFIHWNRLERKISTSYQWRLRLYSHCTV